MSERKNGCYNHLPYGRVYPVQDGWVYVGTTRHPVILDQPHRLSQDCRYSILTPNDAGCIGCKWKAKAPAPAEAAAPRPSFWHRLRVFLMLPP
jgi:hypothetical protein